MLHAVVNDDDSTVKSHLKQRTSGMRICCLN